MDGWGELLQISALKVPPIVHASGQPPQKSVTTLKFDGSHDLLWLGDSSGYLYSFYGLKLQPYTSCRAHKGQINQILPHKKGVITVSSREIRLGSIEGVPLFRIICSPEHGGLRCMTYTSNTQTELLVGGKASSTGSKIFQIDMISGKIAGSFTYHHDLLFMTSNMNYVILGRADGCTDILEPKTKKIVKTFRCHSASLSSLFALDNTLLTTGFSLKKDRFVPDPLVNCFDLKTLSAKTPIPFPSGPTHVYLHPRMPNLALIASNMGQIHLLDIYNPTSLHIYQAELTSYITLFDYSPSGDCFVFLDGMQNLHLWARISDQLATMPTFVLYGKQVQFPDLNAETIPVANRLSFNSLLPPLNSIKLPHYQEMLLSAWPPEMVFQVGKLHKPIDYEILRGIQIIQGFQVAHYDKDKFGKRNVVINYQKQKKLMVPKFISEQDDQESLYSAPPSAIMSRDDLNSAREPKRPAAFAYANFGDSEGTKEHNLLQATNPDESIFSITSSTKDIPNAFRLVRISYSKFGVDDFDFEYYNKTPFTGFEADAGNTYTNCILQLFKYNPAMFNFVTKTLEKDATDTNLLLVELGYLYDKSIHANGKHCAPLDFQRVFSSIPEAQKLGLITENGKRFDDYGQRRLIQVFNRFLLERISKDEQTLYESDKSTNMDALTGVPTETTIYSKFCMLSQKCSTMFHSIDVNSLPVLPTTPRNLTILDYIQSSMSKTIERVVACDVCKRHHPIEASLKVQKLPPTLILNIDLMNEQMNDIRFLKGWLVPSFYMSINEAGIPSLTLTAPENPGSVSFSKYQLSGFVVQVTDRFDRSHPVTITRVPNKDGKIEDDSGWCVFNDFLVAPISEKEALDMSPWWKKPVVVMYRCTDTTNEFEREPWREHLDDSLLYKDHFAYGTREGKIIEYELLTHQEAPKPGTLVAIDSEFVQLAPQQFEITLDGRKKLVMPKKLALGRISAIRCTGPKEGECFIDDYIAATEQIDDYITPFSGIEPDDLYPEKSKRTVVTLQTAYRKMWLLLCLGCIFIGHSLKGDFRMIDIQVPHEQVRDTAELFYLKEEKRKLSLKYLIYQLFNDNVQVGNHDSIEDAMSALRLYRKYLELRSNGKLDETIHRVYLEGQLSQFRIPS